MIITCREPADGLFTPQATLDTVVALANADWHALSGPIAVRGAQPGDTLAVDVIAFEHEGWAWTAVWPGFGVLAQEFGDEYGLQIWSVDNDDAVMKPGIRVPIEPFCGVMGVAPSLSGAYGTMPPRDHGGNVDCKHFCVGSTVYFPVLVPGALFSLGDGHLAQGDGEVCGAALEAPLNVTTRLTLLKDQPIRRIRFVTTRRATEVVDVGGYYGTTAAGDHLEILVRQVVSDMVKFLTDRYELTRMEAYMLCSVAGDLKIAAPKMGKGHAGFVSFHVPQAIFTARAATS